MNTPNGNFIETSIPNNNATITLNIAGKESTMKFTDFVNVIASLLSTPTLQQVTNSGDTTTNVITAAGLHLSTGILQNIGVVGSEPVTPDSCILFTISGQTYKISAQIQP